MFFNLGELGKKAINQVPAKPQILEFLQSLLLLFLFNGVGEGS